MASDDQNETGAEQQQPIGKNQQITSTTTTTTTTTAAVPPPNANSTISSEFAAVTNAIKEKKKIIRRAFSMPRNPFRLSKRVKITNATTKSTSMDATATTPSSQNRGKSAQTADSADEEAATVQNKNNTLPSTLNEHETATATVNGKINHSLMEMSHSEQQQQKDNSKYRMFRRSAWKKFLSRIAQQMTSGNIGAKQSATIDRRVPPLNRHAWPPDQVPGVVGLQNHGNTCFMNAVLQCLSHTDILAEYFVLDQYKADLKRRNKINSRKFGTKGELTEQLALVLKALWTCKNESDYSTSFKAVVDRYGSQFRSSTQHDAQEFLFWLLDKVHEDLNTASKRKYKPIKNNYGRPDEVIAAETLANHIRCNNSFVQAVFQAQFRSSLACPRCHKQSNTFDPFHCISVQLPQLAQQAVFVTVLYATQHPRQVKLGLSVPLGSPMIALREQLQADTGILLDRMVLTEIQSNGFVRVFCDSHPISTLSPEDSIYCIEIKGDDATTTTDTTKTTNTGTNLTKSNANNGANDANTTTKLTLIMANVKRLSPKESDVERFGTPFCVQVNRDISYTDLQKALLKEMRTILKPDVFTYATPPTEMFKICLQDPSADPDTYIEPNVEHPLFTEMIDLALSVLPNDAGPQHVKLLLEWKEPEKFFCDTSDPSVEHESVSQLQNKIKGDTSLTLEQCLEHYTKAETLSAEDAWRCPHCQKYLPVVKTLGLWSLPDILVIHFKRFRQQHTKGPQSAKLTTTVTFPLADFDMSPHLARDPANTNNGDLIDDNWSPWRKLKRRDLNSDLKDNRYDLYAVCYHQGDTLETGHYTAACKNPYDHQWYKFDDQRVNVVPADQVQKEIVNNEAYILFYQRRKIDNSDCSGSSSGSSDHWVSKISIPPSTNNRSTSVRASMATLNADEKKEIVEKIAEEPEKIEVDKVSTHSKEMQAEDCAPSTSVDEALAKPIETNQTVVEINHLTPSTDPVKVEPTDEDEIVDVEGLGTETEQPIEFDAPVPEDVEKPVTAMEIVPSSAGTAEIVNASPEDDINIEVELRNIPAKKAENALSTSFPTQRSLWPFENHHNTIHTYTPILNRGSLNFNDMLTNNLRRERDVQLRHSLSTSLSQQRNSHSSDAKNKLINVAANDTIAMLRGVSSCSKDTLIYIDQQSHHRSLMDEENNYMANQSLWISPVTPHKLITVSPKN